MTVPFLQDLAVQADFNKFRDNSPESDKQETRNQAESVVIFGLLVLLRSHKEKTQFTSHVTVDHCSPSPWEVSVQQIRQVVNSDASQYFDQWHNTIAPEYIYLFCLYFVLLYRPLQFCYHQIITFSSFKPIGHSNLSVTRGQAKSVYCYSAKNARHN